MAAPTITSVSPANSETDVILGTQIKVTFDQLIDHATITDSTFSLTGPGQTMVLTPEQLVAEDPEAVTGREYIEGTFTFDDTAGYTVVTFNPSKPLQPNKQYVVLVLGGDAVLSTDSVKNVGAEPLATTYQWSFATGTL